MEHLSHPMVEKVFELSRSVGGEAHNLKGFLRFRELENGVLYAPITPKARCLPVSHRILPTGCLWKTG